MHYLFLAVEVSIEVIIEAVGRIVKAKLLVHLANGVKVFVRQLKVSLEVFLDSSWCF